MTSMNRANHKNLILSLLIFSGIYAACGCSVLETEVDNGL